jgi:hypothetical protein
MVRFVHNGVHVLEDDVPVVRVASAARNALRHHSRRLKEGIGDLGDR